MILNTTPPKLDPGNAGARSDPMALASAPEYTTEQADKFISELDKQVAFASDLALNQKLSDNTRRQDVRASEKAAEKSRIIKEWNLEYSKQNRKPFRLI